MKEVILKFETEDIHDKADLEMALKGRDAYLALYRIENMLSGAREAENFLDGFWEILRDLVIDLTILP